MEAEPVKVDLLVHLYVYTASAHHRSLPCVIEEHGGLQCVC